MRQANNASLCLKICTWVMLGVSAVDAKAAPESERTSNAQAETGVVEHVELGTEDVLERLKLLRVQMALDREEIAALELRIKKIELKRAFEELLAGGREGKTKRRVPRSDPTMDVLVKAISLKPRKEAIILYRGRVYNVRPGDTVGGMTIRDITQSGLKVARLGRGRVALVR